MIPLPEVFHQIPLAHRALHDKAEGRPENSRAAIRAAMDAGYGIEIDLQLSNDGQAMVFHDYDLSRLTGLKGKVRDRSAEDLGQITLSGGNEGIPTLAEVLELVAGQVPLLIELKDQHGAMGETDGALEQAVARDLAGYEGPVAVMSFNPHSVAQLSDLSPDTARGLVTQAYSLKDEPLLSPKTRRRLRDIVDYDRCKASFISHRWSDLARPRVAELKAAGASVLCWTIRSPIEEAKAREVADNVTFEKYLAQYPA
ncbi:cytoplasmic glycerophosphodiester phosphodiesterase [Roseovarius albus]|uniref:Cytoplasmic glycerophosphodiester phosphodiesterase n=1 Tax=Roseovarius albus TaxID=1247867 RepID=A0A1X6ZKT8_9RHOB|nr:glycerophosphodiester phosphodiesterase family protein [Roseovarius albus]SLN54235.1 cytoplasmic glycerophosphodiester phosphodiesterase [Roseovarius albus]